MQTTAIHPASPAEPAPARRPRGRGVEFHPAPFLSSAASCSPPHTPSLPWPMLLAHHGIWAPSPAFAAVATPAAVGITSPLVHAQLATLRCKQLPTLAAAVSSMREPSSALAPRRRPPPLMAAAVSSEPEPSFAAVFQEAVNAQAAAEEPAPRAHWANKFRPLGYLLAFCAASYSIVPLMLFLNLFTYVAWAVSTFVAVIRMVATGLSQRRRGLDMDVANTFAADYSEALASGDVEPRSAPEPDISTMQAQVLQSIQEDE